MQVVVAKKDSFTISHQSIGFLNLLTMFIFELLKGARLSNKNISIFLSALL